jgi:hypothetical protein
MTDTNKTDIVKTIDKTDEVCRHWLYFIKQAKPVPFSWDDDRHKHNRPCQNN